VLITGEARRECSWTSAQTAAAPASPWNELGRVYEPVYRLKEEFIDEAFEDVRKRGMELVIPDLACATRIQRRVIR